MNCPPRNRNIDKKPKMTETTDYVWSEVMGNPNLFCWIPVSKKLTNPMQTDIAKLNIQDIPPVPNFTDNITKMAEEAIQNKKDDSLKRLRKKTATYAEKVSVDDPKKYPIVKEFIAKRGLKIYGGVAINSYLPEEAKFYNPKDIPDYDFFSPDPWNDATDLADIFHEKGYQFIEARAGIHKGTYKVLVDLWPVADITYVPQKEFDKIETVNIGGVKVVNPFKLLESMYKEFSEPYANASRWPKVAIREKLLQKWLNPLKNSFRCSKNLFFEKDPADPLLAKLLEKVYKFILVKKLLITGSVAYNTFIKLGAGDKRVGIDHYSVLSENSREDTQELFDSLLKLYDHLEITTQFFPHRELNNTTYTIFAIIDNEYKILCKITHLTSCTPYVKIGKLIIVSIDYLKYELFENAVFGDSEQEREDTKCKLQYLTEIQYNYYKTESITETDKSPLQRFITKCKGPFQENIKVAILNKWLEREKEKEKVVREWTEEYKIRKIPHEKLPQECSNKDRRSCRYPCAWNKYIGRCSGISKGIYRPGDTEELEYLGGGKYE
jgi:hypothetical protein